MFAWCAVLIAGVGLAGGCKAGFRTSSGGATAPPGVGGGTTRSLVFGDEGGLLTRAAVVGLGGVAAGGAVRDVKTERTVTSGVRPGERIITTTTTGTVDRKAAENALGIMQAATDPDTSFSSRSGGLGATLEIASTKLGGDTSGWMFRFGGVFRLTHNDGKILHGLRGTAGIGFGRFTLHRRLRRTYQDLNLVEDRMGDWDYNYLGVPLRAGYVVGKVLNQKAVIPYAGAEVFVQADANVYTAFGVIIGETDYSPSPWHAGIRLNYYIGYLEAMVSMSSMNSNERSVGLEVGLGF